MKTRIPLGATGLCGLGLLLAAGGCGPRADSVIELTVRGVTANGHVVRCRPIELAEAGFECLYCPMDRIQLGRGERYSMRVLRGQLLVVSFGDPDERSGRTFPWRYDPQDGQALSFDCDGPALLVNGRLATLDLIDPGTARWIESHPTEDLSEAGCVVLKGDWDTDRPVLALLRGAGTVLDLSRYGERLTRELTEAVLACRPAGLLVAASPSADELLLRAGDLRYLVYNGVPPELPHREALLSLIVGQSGMAERPGKTAWTDEANAPPIPLDWLGRYGNLRVLALETGDRAIAREGHVQIGRLTELYSLFCGRSMPDLGLLSGLTKLEILAMGGAKEVRDLSPLRACAHLRRLMILELPEDVRGLDVLTTLPKLEVAVLDKSLLKAREAEIARIRKERPDLLIQGFCLGSRWMLAVVVGGAAVGFGLGWARRRGRSCAAA